MKKKCNNNYNNPFYSLFFRVSTSRLYLYVLYASVCSSSSVPTNKAIIPEGHAMCLSSRSHRYDLIIFYNTHNIQSHRRLLISIDRSTPKHVPTQIYVVR